MEPSHEYRHAHQAQGIFFDPMDAIRHNRDISAAWTIFVLDKSDSFTQANVEDAIASPVDIRSSIVRYQKTLP